MKPLKIFVFAAGTLSLSIIALQFFVTPDKSFIFYDQDAAGPTDSPEPTTPEPLYPDSIPALRERIYQGSDIVIEKTLTAGANYQRYVASYLSDGLKIYGLLTIPNTKTPESGFPAIVFNHGSIPPDEYKTTERYAAYQDGLARNGYVTFKIDYRGHGSSEGTSASAWYTSDYIVDVIQATASLQKHRQVNPDKIGMWGHSMGGHLTTAAMVILPDIKVGVVWAGLTASHDEVFDSWRNRRRPTSTIPMSPTRYATRNPRNEMIEKYGTWQENPTFWDALAPTSFLQNLSGPILLLHGQNDERVSHTFSEDLASRIIAADKEVKLILYPNTDHNVSQNFSKAMAASVKFFDEYLK